MEFTLDKLAKDVAEKALNEIIYEGKTLREWVEIIVKQQPCEDCISREQTLKAFAEKCGGECACCEYNGSGYDNAENCKLIKSMPSVIPKTDVLNKIRAEIADLEEGISSYHNDRPWVFKNEVLQIIDKYKAESEDKK